MFETAAWSKGMEDIMTRELRLNAFAMNCVGHQSQGLWRHPRDRSPEYKHTDHWVDLACLLERGKFDGLFLADVVGVYDVYGGSPDTAIREAVQVPTNDPLLVIPPMAQATQHLAFAATVNLSHEAPLQFARRMSTLDHMTDGRIGWNIVTGYLDSGAKGAGASKQVAHDIRYDIAEEFMDIQYGFWEGSWEDDALRCDRAAGVFTDPSKVHRVVHEGEYFRSTASTCVSPRRSARRCFTRLAPRRRARRSPPGTRNAFSWAGTRGLRWRQTSLSFAPWRWKPAEHLPTSSSSPWRP